MSGSGRPFTGRLLVLCFLIGLIDSQQTETKDTIQFGVYLDAQYLGGSVEGGQGTINKAVETTNAKLKRHTMVPEYYQDIGMVDSKNISMMFVVGRCDNVQEIAEVIGPSGICQVAITDGPCMRPQVKFPDTSMMVPISDAKGKFLQFVMDLRNDNMFTWKQIVIVHDDSYPADVIQDTVTQLTQGENIYNDTQVTVFFIGKEFNGFQREQKTKELLSRIVPEYFAGNFLIMMEEDNAYTTMEVAQNLYPTLINQDNRFLLMISDTHSTKYDMSRFLPFIKDGDHVSFIYNQSYVGSKPCGGGLECYINEMIDAYGRGLDQRLDNEWATRSLVSAEEWAETQPTHAERAVEVMNTMKSILRLGGQCGNCTKYGLAAGEIVSMTKSVMLDVGYWMAWEGIYHKDDLFPHLTGGLRGRTIPVTALEYPPWQIFKRDSAGKIVEYTGIMFEVFNEIGKQMNFTYAVYPPADGLWGEQYEPGKWNGMINLIKNKEVMAGVGAFVISRERSQVINYTNPMDIVGYTYMYDRPKELSRALLFVRPFKKITWLCIFLMCASAGPLLWLINRSSYYYTYYNIERRGGLFALHHCLWYTYGAVLQQGGTYLPNSISGRMMTGFYWLFIIVVVTTYSGSLVAFLTFPNIQNPLNNIEQLMEKGKGRTWGTQKGTALTDYLKESTSDMYKELYEGLIQHDKTSDEKMLNQVRQGKHVLIEWRTNLIFLMKERYLKTDRCDYSLAKEDFFTERISLAVPQDSPYIKKFNFQINKMLQGGLPEKWQRMFYPPDDKCSATATGEVDQHRVVTVADMQGSFYILGFGVVGGLLLLLHEYLKGKDHLKAGREPKACDDAKSRGLDMPASKDTIKPFVA